MRAGVVPLSLMFLVLVGCPSHPKNGECRTSDDCKAQQGYGHVCVQGRCQECGADTDCGAGFVCRANACAPRPECESSADCSNGGTCQAGRCVAAAKPECDGDAACGPGRACRAGHCVDRGDQAAAPRCGGDDEAVYFHYDSARLDPGARTTLDAIARCLKPLPAPRFVIEGHCDDRGTAEYNVHLGERRAEAVRSYLSQLGVDAAALRTLSYGKERPVCTDHSRACWSKNRRAVLRPDVTTSAR